MEKPKEGSTWKHYNGIEYFVLFITNEKSQHLDKYPPTVVYENPINETLWSRPLNDWHRSMTHVKDED